MERLRLLSRLVLLCGLALLAAPLSALVTLSGVQVSNVTTSTATVLWRTSEVSTPGLDVFANSAGTVSLAGQVGIEFFPLTLGDVGWTDDAAARAARRTLQEATRQQQLVLVRLTGLAPATTYYLRPRSFTAPGGADSAASVTPLVAVATPASTSFVANAQVLVVDFTDLPGADGLVAVLSGPDGTVPLTSVVGDAGFPGKAVFSLADFIDAALGSNAAFSGAVDFTLRLVGRDAPTEAALYALTFAPGTVIAGGTEVSYGSAGPVAFAFDPIPDQSAGLAFTITVRALKAGGDVLTSFNGTATLTGVDLGGGTTPAFVAGRLQGHVVAINLPGTRVLTLARSGVTADSNSFRVSDTFNAWRNARFSAEELASPAVSGPNADPGSYGVPNLLRYAFNTGSNPPNRGLLPRFAGVQINGSSYLSIVFERSAYAEDIAYIVESSGNMATWSPVETVYAGTPTAVSVRDTVPVTLTSPRYMRVRVVQRATFANYLSGALPAELRALPEATAVSGDFGGRGVPNLLRFAFNMDPVAPSPGHLPAASIVAGEGGQSRLAITFRRLPSAMGALRYLVQTSSDLQTWTTIETVLPGTPESVTVQDTQALGGTPRFIRVQVEL